MTNNQTVEKENVVLKYGYHTQRKDPMYSYPYSLSGRNRFWLNAVYVSALQAIEEEGDLDMQVRIPFNDDFIIFRLNSNDIYPSYVHRHKKLYDGKVDIGLTKTSFPIVAVKEATGETVSLSWKALSEGYDAAVA